MEGVGVSYNISVDCPFEFNWSRAIDMHGK